MKQRRPIQRHPSSALLRALPVAALAALFALTGCLEVDRTTLQLSWQFPDQATCAEAGVVDVEVEVTSTQLASAVFSCAAGRAPAAVELGEFEPGLVTVRARGLDANGVEVLSASGQQAIRGDVLRAELLLVP